MLGKHINKKQQYKFVVIGILILISLLAILSNVFLNISSSFAQNNSNVSVVYSANPNDDADMNYGTKEYWDEHYVGTKNYLTSLSPGQVLGKDGQTTDYFIAQDLNVTGNINNGDPAGIVIKGQVNFYFEAKDASDLTGPTLKATGGSSKGSADGVPGSGAGIELLTGSTLRVYGRGIINATGGDVSWRQQDINKPSDGGSASETDADSPYSGYGGNGGAGSGGTGAAIGSNGGAGGKGAPKTKNLSGFNEEKGPAGGNGGDGSGTDSVGNIKISGNIKIITNNGNITDYLKAVVPRDGGNRASQSDVALWINYTFNPGGGGAYGGCGWIGAPIGSGGSGGGGGGAGGGGSIVYEGYSGDFCSGSGGGGGSGATSSKIAYSHGGAFEFSNSDYKEQATYGTTSEATNDGGNYSAQGGKGASGSDNPACGNGGNGGKGGISGDGGSFYGPFVPETIIKNYGSYYSKGRDADQIKCFPASELKIADSIVDWCTALYPWYSEEELKLIHFPTGTLVDRDFYTYSGEEGDFGEVKVLLPPVWDREWDCYHITKDDLVSPSDEYWYKVWVISKGVVDLSLSSDEMLYNGKEVNIRDFISAKYGDEEVISNIPGEEIYSEWWKVDGDKEIKLEQAPVDAGTYKVKYYIKGLEYISRTQEVSTFTISPRENLKLTPKDINLKTGSPLPEKSTIEIISEGQAEYEKLVYDEDYSITFEKQSEDKYIIIISAKDPLKRNYKNIITEEGIILFRDHSVKATAVSASKTYGEADPVFDATFSDWDDPQHPTPVLNKDYFVSRIYGEDVNTYAIKLTINYEDNSVFKDYVVECVDATFTINKKNASIMAKDASKQYGDEDPIFETELNGFKFGDVPVLREDYEFVVNPTSQFDKYSIDIHIIEGGPLSKNYILSGNSGTLTITKRNATITPDTKYVLVGKPDVPLTITTENMLSDDVLVAGTDYNISREPGTVKGSYKIFVEIIEPRTAHTQNYNFTLNEGVYAIYDGLVTVSAVPTTIPYQGKEITEDTFRTIQLHTDSEGLTPQDLEYGTDYQLTKAEGKDVNTYTLYVHILESCRYLDNIKFYTEPSTITISPVNASLVINDVTDVNYGDDEHELTVKKIEGLVNGEELTPNDYELFREYGTNVGTYDIDAVINPDGDIAKNYSFTVSKGIYKINKIDAYLETIGTDDDNTVIEKVYGQNDPDIPAKSYRKDEDGNEIPLPYEETFIYNQHFLSSRIDGENVGTYPITIFMNEGAIATYNYNVHITSNKPLKILPFTFSDAIVNTVEAVEYTGQPLCPDIYAYYDFVPNELNASANRKVFEVGKDFTIVYENNIEVGTATATLTPDGENVVGEPRVVEFEILPHIEPDPGNVTPAVSTGDYNYLLIFGILVVFVLCSIVLLRKYNK